MKLKILIPTIFTGLLVVACGSHAPLSNHGAKVTVVKNEPLHCKETGRYYGRGPSLEYAMNNLRNIIGEEGGNRVYVSRVEDVDGVGGTFVVGNDHTAYGVGFYCN